MSKFVLFPKERPELGDCWAVYCFLPFTGAHLYYMKEKKKGLIRSGILLFWLLFPFVFNQIAYISWIYAGFIMLALWIFDGVTLKRLFEKKWGKSQSFRI